MYVSEPNPSPRFLTNLKIEDADLYLDAAQSTGVAVFIRQLAYTRTGMPLPPMFVAAWTNSEEPSAEFWAEVGRLRGAQQEL